MTDGGDRAPDIERSVELLTSEDPLIRSTALEASCDDGSRARS
jgi:hypothetical protein